MTLSYNFWSSQAVVITVHLVLGDPPDGWTVKEIIILGQTHTHSMVGFSMA